MGINIHRPRVLLMLLVTAVVAAGLLALAASPAWAEWYGFSDPQNYPVGESPLIVTSADFNGDGEKDLATVNFGNYPDASFPRPEILGGVSVLLSNGDGSFQPNQDFEITNNSHPRSVTSAHFNGDGYADLVVPNSASDNIAVFLSNGDGTFQDPKVFAAGDGPLHATTADFNGDGNADLAVPNKTSDDVSILLGNGDGTFQAANNFPAGDAPESAINADFNGDSNADLAVLRKSLDAASVLLGNGDGTFQEPKSFSVEDETTSLASADLDGDNKADLASAHRPSFGSTTSPREGVSVFLGNGDGTFQAAKNFSVSWNDGYRRNPEQVIATDFNGDKKLDLATSNRGTFWTGNHGASVLLGKGDGTFQEAQEFKFGINPSSLTSADFDGDNFADLGVADEGSNDLNFETSPDEVSVLLNMNMPGPTEVTIDSGPPQLTNSTTASFVFSSNESDATFKCSLDGADPLPCTSTPTSPWHYTGLSEGNHSFEVMAFGAAGPEFSGSAYWDWTVDTTAPAAPVISSPPESGRVGGSFTVSGTAEPDSTVQLWDGATSKGTTTASSTGTWSIALSGITEGSHTYKAKATDKAGNASAESNPRTVTVDTTAPMVDSTTPLNQATEVGRGISPTAYFSEKVATSSINTSTFKFYKCSSTKDINCTTQLTGVHTVSLSTDGRTATLNPYGTSLTLLASSTKYKAVVTTGVRDEAGNALNQQKVWYFTTARK